MKKTELTFIGVGAIDNFVLNQDVPEEETDDERARPTVFARCAANPKSVELYHRIKIENDSGKMVFWTFVLSRNMLNNESYKYAGNDESNESNLLFRYISQESENKFRAENSIFGKGYTLKYGVNYQYSRYFINNFDRATLASSGQVIDVESTSNF